MEQRGAKRQRYTGSSSHVTHFARRYDCSIINAINTSDSLPGPVVFFKYNSSDPFTRAMLTEKSFSDFLAMSPFPSTSTFVFSAYTASDLSYLSSVLPPHPSLLLAPSLDTIDAVLSSSWLSPVMTLSAGDVTGAGRLDCYYGSCLWPDEQDYDLGNFSPPPPDLATFDFLPLPPPLPYIDLLFSASLSSLPPMLFPSSNSFTGGAPTPKVGDCEGSEGSVVFVSCVRNGRGMNR